MGVWDLCPHTGGAYRRSGTCAAYTGDACRGTPVPQGTRRCAPRDALVRMTERCPHAHAVHAVRGYMGWRAHVVGGILGSSHSCAPTCLDDAQSGGCSTIYQIYKKSSEK